MSSTSVLPQHLHAELDLSCVERTYDGAEVRRAAVARGRREIVAVEEVERLDADLQLRGAAEGEVLARGRIELPEAGPADVVARRVTQGLARIGRDDDARRVEPAGNRLLRRVRIAGEVGPVVVCAGE